MLGATCLESSIKTTNPALCVCLLAQTGMILVRWTAPEGLSGAKFSSASDVWSFGIVVVEVLQDGAAPYPGTRSNPAVISLVVSGGVHPKPEECVILSDI